jgi:hypothetical protein
LTVCSNNNTVRLMTFMSHMLEKNEASENCNIWQKFMKFATLPVWMCKLVSIFTLVEAWKTLHRCTFCPEEL